MNWYEVRKHNAKRSARKARREATEAARKARIERAGGPITADEVRDATFRIEPPAHGYGHERFVWTLRGRDWVLGYSDGDQWQALAPFCSWRQDPDTRELVPFTPGARKAFAKRLAEQFPAEVEA